MQASAERHCLIQRLPNMEVIWPLKTPLIILLWTPNKTPGFSLIFGIAAGGNLETLSLLIRTLSHSIQRSMLLK
jgi:hypothetical protein